MESSQSNKTIVVIGANGMLGSMLMRQLPTGTIAADRDSIDITSIDSVNNFVEQYKPDVIINAAAYTAVDDCESNEEVANAVNGEGPKNLAMAAKKHEATLVHYSTDYVFSGELANGYSESYNNIDPVNAYGRSKALGEAGIQEVADETWKQWYIIRTAWLYGPGGNNFVETMLQLADNRDQLTVVNDQHGSPTYTEDLATVTQEIITDKYLPGIYHVINDGACTWYDFAAEIFKQTNTEIDLQPCTSSEFPRPAKRPTYSILLNTKGPKARPWQEGLAAYLLQR